MDTQFNLLSDTGCELGKAFLDEHQVKALHFSYAEANEPDGGFHGTDDFFESITPHDFYEAMRKGATPSTSQPSQGEFEEVFRECIATGKPTVYLCFSSGISGCYEGACVAAQRLEPEMGNAPVHIIDLRCASTTQALVVDEAIRQRERGLSLEEFLTWLDEWKWYAQTIFMVDNLDALHRGGRIPRSVSVVGGKLDVKPLLAFDRAGGLTIVSVARGRKKGIKRLADHFIKYHDSYLTQPVAAIGSADVDPKDIETLKNLITEQCGPVRFIDTNIGPVIGCHVGAGMMSCCFWGTKPRTR